eukprot:TRINITY_DN1046_c1_g1_i3.p1 TRINITY_DN1046_c1_g1~~TRINITY_DN1046_c1_g1_i3.p1  ORF type:complete len:1026 (+),score=213.48 TRINITY_DN1046_c1_g1_i3:234-3080(+)
MEADTATFSIPMFIPKVVQQPSRAPQVSVGSTVSGAVAPEPLRMAPAVISTPVVPAVPLLPVRIHKQPRPQTVQRSASFSARVPSTPTTMLNRGVRAPLYVAPPVTAHYVVFSGPGVGSKPKPKPKKKPKPEEPQLPAKKPSVPRLRRSASALPASALGTNDHKKAQSVTVMPSVTSGLVTSAEAGIATLSLTAKPRQQQSSGVATDTAQTDDAVPDAISLPAELAGLVHQQDASDVSAPSLGGVESNALDEPVSVVSDADIEASTVDEVSPILDSEEIEQQCATICSDDSAVSVPFSATLEAVTHEAPEAPEAPATVAQAFTPQTAATQDEVMFVSAAQSDALSPAEPLETLAATADSDGDLVDNDYHEPDFDCVALPVTVPTATTALTATTSASAVTTAVQSALDQSPDAEYDLVEDADVLSVEQRLQVLQRLFHGLLPADVIVKVLSNNSNLLDVSSIQLSKLCADRDAGSGTVSVPANYRQIFPDLSYISSAVYHGARDATLHMDELAHSLHDFNGSGDASSCAMRGVRLCCISQNRAEVHAIVSHALAKLGNWIEVSSTVTSHWNLLWTWSRPRINYNSLLSWQRVNHYPHSDQLTRKDTLKRSLGRYTMFGEKTAELFTITPVTFILPGEYVPFCDSFAKHRDMPGMQNFWIMKPVGLSRGRGIELVTSIADVNYGQAVVIQKYIERPLLIEGYKFDLRLYVLVTSFSPAEAFIYTRGFVRLSTVPFSLDMTQKDNKFVHLTNSSIQKHATHVPAIMTDTIVDNGTKFELPWMWKHLQARGIDVATTWAKIIEVVLKSLFCGEDGIPHCENAFELFGYDVMLDENCRPWLIEVNAGPSMACENQQDIDVKHQLIADTIDLVNPLDFDRVALEAILVRRMTGRPRHINNTSPQQLNADLQAVLRNAVPRQYGEMPKQCGAYERIAPSKFYDMLGRLRRKSKRT